MPDVGTSAGIDDTWASPAWMMSAVGLLLLAASAWYYTAFSLYGAADPWADGVTFDVVLSLFEFVLLVSFAVALVYGGYWLSRTRFTAEHEWWVVLWFILGIGGVVSVVVLVQFNQLLDGRGITYQTFIEELLLAAGGGGVVGFFTGLTNAELRQKRAEVAAQRDAFESLNDFLRHNVLNGLQYILGYADLLADHVDEQGAGRQYLDSIRTRGDRVAFVVQNAGKLTRGIAADADGSVVNLSSLLAAELDDLAATYEGVTWTRTIEADVHVAGGERVAVVLRSLLGALIQQADSDEPTVDVTLETTSEAGLITLAGPDIPRADGSSAAAADTGQEEESAYTRDELGLELARLVVEGDGGDVWLETTGTDGGTVKLRLPRRAPA